MRINKRLCILFGLSLAVVCATFVFLANHSAEEDAAVNNSQPNLVSSYKQDSPTATTPSNKTQSTTEPTKAKYSTSTKPKQTVIESPKNPYPVGLSAWYVFNRRQELGKPMPDQQKNYGDGTHYCYQLKKVAPTKLVNKPQRYSIGCIPSQTGHHLVIVERLNNDGTMWVSEMNASGQKSITNPAPSGGWHNTDYRKLPSTITNIYVL